MADAVDPGSGAISRAAVSTAFRPHGWLARALTATAISVFVASTYLAVVHVGDTFQLDHVSGARMALAHHFDQGVLYPELYDGERFGGTRFMPVPIVLHGLLSKATDEYLISGKLVSYAVAGALLLCVYVLLRRTSCPRPLAAILVALVLTTQVGFVGSMDMRLDTLPLLLQLVAVWTIREKEGPTHTAVSAVLASLAFMSKLSAVWAPIAIVVWLVHRDRRRAALFATMYLVSSASLLIVASFVTQGRLLENVIGLAASGISGVSSAIVAPYRFLHLLFREASVAWALVPLAGFLGWRYLRAGADRIYVVAVVCSIGIAIAVLTDVGTGRNQLLDPVVLTIVVIGVAFGAREPRDALIPSPVARLTALSLLWVTVTGAVVTLMPPVRAALSGHDSYPTRPLAEIANHDTRILSDDPYLPLSLGQTPIILDAFMLPRLARAEPDAVRDLVSRIERREFEVIALVEPLEPVDRTWWRELDLGLSVAKAIAGSYVYSRSVAGHHLYIPTDDQHGSDDPVAP